jgi:hypothetical protein
MYVKRLRRKCGVRGCRNIDTFSISLSREAGNTVNICASCLGKAFGAIDDVPEAVDRRTLRTEAPALFFNSRIAPVEEPAEETPAEEAVAVTEEVIDNEEAVDVEEPVEEAVEEPELPDEDDELVYVCPYCDLVCKTEQGLQRHIEAKHKDKA